MENKLITTDGLWYKIKNFFKKFLFYKKNKLKISIKMFKLLFISCTLFVNNVLKIAW